jgi:hypothetical protein
MQVLLRRTGLLEIEDLPRVEVRFSVKPLRTGIQMEPMATPYGRQLVVRGVLPVPAR